MRKIGLLTPVIWMIKLEHLLQLTVIYDKNLITHASSVYCLGTAQKVTDAFFNDHLYF